MFHTSKQHYDSKINKTDSVIYFNANIYNDPTPPQKAKIARFDQSIGSGSVVDLPENYYMAVIRFAISHMIIPLYLFKDNYYTVTLFNNNTGLDHRVALTYSTAGNAYSSYGYNQPVLFYEQFVFMINQAFTTANLALPLADRADLPPFVNYDTNTEKFTLFIPVQYFGRVGVYFNANLYQQFQLINSEFMGYNQTAGKDYLIKNYAIPDFPVGYAPLNQLTIPGAAPPPPVTFLSFTQERSALYLLNEVQSIVFTSTTLNVTKEFIGKNDGTGNAGSLSILADFVPDQSTGRDLSEYQYNAQGNPRLVNLTNTIPITNIDYQVGIRYRDGTLIPLYLEPGEVCEVKFGFFKKSLYDNNFIY